MIVEYTIKSITEYYTNNSEIFHIFPITISLSITLLLASYLLLY